MGTGRGIWVAVAASFLVVLASSAGAQSPPSVGTPAMTSERISLDLKGVDILDVLKLFSQKSGLNFVAGRNVAGKVTIFVKDVDVWEAFELIIGANDLAYERRGGIVTVMMARDYELLYGEKFQERKQSLVLPLQYAKAIQAAREIPGRVIGARMCSSQAGEEPARRRRLDPRGLGEM